MQLKLLFKIIVVLLLLFLLWNKIEIEKIKNTYRNSNLIFLSIAVAVLYFSFFIQSYRFKMILELYNCKISIAKLFKNNLIANSFSQFLPGSIAGDVFKLIDLSRFAAKKIIIGCVLIDRVLGLLTLCFVSGIFLCLLDLIHAEYVAWYSGLFVTIGFLTPFLLFFSLVYLNPIFKKYFNIFINIGLSGFLFVLFLSIASHILFVGFIYLLAMAFHFNSVAIFAYPFSVLIGSLPISIAGWGVRELTFSSMAGLYGVEHAESISFSIAYGVSYLCMNLPGILIYLLRRKIV